MTLCALLLACLEMVSCFPPLLILQRMAALEGDQLQMTELPVLLTGMSLKLPLAIPPGVVTYESARFWQPRPTEEEDGCLGWLQAVQQLRRRHEAGPWLTPLHVLQVWKSAATQ